jgi:hypothetical protein
MRALVVYESMYGDTKRVADAVADGLAGGLAVETVEVSLAPVALESGIDLLVVGGPTHVHGMTTPFTRAQAIKQAQTEIVSRGIGIREWLEELRPAVPGVAAAAFDTRIRGAAILTGSAASGYAKRLRDARFRLLAPAESFLIATKAPQGDALLEGELERARAWGAGLAATLAARAAITTA